MRTYLMALTLLALVAFTAFGCAGEDPIAPPPPPNEDNGNENGNGNGNDDGNEEEAGVDGLYDGTGLFSTDMTVRDVDDVGEPANDSCAGDITVVIDSGASTPVSGQGSCRMAANAASYVLVGDFDSATAVSGTLTFTFNNRQLQVDWAGTIQNGLLEASYRGTTPFVGRLVIDWDGSFTAELQ